MKKFLYLLLPALCLMLLASGTYASVTSALYDGIRGAPPGIAVHQDREGSYAAPSPVAAQPSIETAFLPQSTIFVASANETFTAANKGAVAVVDDTAVAVRSGVLAPAIKDFFASISTFGRTSTAEKSVKEGVMPLAVGKVFSGNSIFFKVILAVSAPAAGNSEVMPLAIKPTVSTVAV